MASSSSQPTSYDPLHTLLASLPSAPLTSHDLSLLTSSLLSTNKPLAYIILTKSFESESHPSTPLLKRYIYDRLSETELQDVIGALALCKATLEINSDAGKEILSEEGMIDTILDLVEFPFFSTESISDTPSPHSQVQLAIADLLNTACNIPTLRSLLKPRAEKWLSSMIGKGQEGKGELEVLCVVALTKLGRASGADPMLGIGMGKTGEEQSSEGKGTEESSSDSIANDEEKLSKMLSSVIISDNNPSKTSTSNESITSAIEGLAYTSLNPQIKESLSLSKPFLASLFHLASSTSSTPSTARKSALSPSYSLNLDNPQDPKSTALQYGISIIILNICSRKAQLTEEQNQVEKLRKMANGGLTKGGTTEGKMGSGLKDTDPLESDEAVEDRITRLLRVGVVPAANVLSKTTSLRVKEVVGRLYLELLWEKEDRLAVIKEGGGKALLGLVGALLGDMGVKKSDDGKRAASEETDKPSFLESSSPSSTSLPAIQALAKLIITTPPLNLFGPQFTSSSLDCVRPISHLLQNSSSSLLQRFESLMALTNLASIGPEVASRIMSQGEELLRKIESDMLEDHELVRRAAVELVCNLATSEEGFCRYTGEDPGTLSDGTDTNLSTAQVGKRKAAKNRLRILLAMTDVDDLPTRLAAAGGLASLVQSRIACESLLSLDGNSSKSWDRIVSMLQPARATGGEDDLDENDEVEEISTAPPDEGLVHRALVIAVDLLTYIDSLPPSERKGILDTAVQSGLLREFMGLLAMWTAQRPTPQSLPPKKELVDATVECLRLMKAGGVELVL